MNTSDENDDFCDQFEAAWRSDRKPTIEEFLARAAPENREPLLQALLEIELELRSAAGEVVSVDDYKTRFPEQQAVLENANVEFQRRLKMESVAETVIPEGLPAGSRRSEGGSTSTESDGEDLGCIGPYRLIRRLGAGGMGTVFRAEQMHPIRRTVAVKIIRRNLDSEAMIPRFEAERQALAMMDHPNIAKVLDAGLSDDGEPFLVMELIDGQAITEHCDEHCLDLPARLGLFIQTCRAIQHAHLKSIIHRDIKPSNILVAQTENGPVVKVIDFGLAKAFDEEVWLTDKTLFTDFGAVVGTLAYMSPEQAMQNSRDIDTRSDVYSLGALLYEMLTGTTPIERCVMQTLAMRAMLDAIQTHETPRPSDRVSSTATVIKDGEPPRNAGYPAASQLRSDLDWIALKALEKSRDRRYQTPAELAADVERYLNLEPVTAGPPSLLYRFRKFVWRQPKTIVATLLALLATVFLPTSYLWWQANEAEKRALQGEKEAAEAGERAAKRDQTLSELCLAEDFGDPAKSRLQSIDAALGLEFIDEEGRCQLLLTKFDLLRSIQEFAEAREILTSIRPVSAAQQKQLWIRQLVDSEAEAERSDLLAKLMADTTELSASDVLFLQAMQASERTPRMSFLEQTLQINPRHRDARQQLIVDAVMTGTSKAVYDLCRDGKLVYPDDLFFDIAPAFAAAFADDAVEFEQRQKVLSLRLSESDNALLSSVLESVRHLPHLLDGWDTGRAIDLEFIKKAMKFAEFGFRAESASPAVSDPLRRLTLGTGSEPTGQDAVSALAAAAPRIAIAIGAVAFGNTKPFVSLMSDLENSSPIKGDAFFSFARAIPGIVGDDTPMAQQELEECIVRPSIIPYFRTESQYAMAMVYRMRLVETKDQAFLGKSLDAFRKWLQFGPRLHRDRLNYAVMTCLEGGDTELAMKFVELAEQKIPDEKALILQSRLKILIAEKHFSGVIEMVDRTLKEETADEALQKSLAESRNEAIRKLRELTAVQNGTNELAPVEPDAQSLPK